MVVEVTYRPYKYITIKTKYGRVSLTMFESVKVLNEMIRFLGDKIKINWKREK